MITIIVLLIVTLRKVTQIENWVKEQEAEELAHYWKNYKE